MASTTNALAVKRREKTGTTSVAALKKTGFVPGVLFGHGSEPMPIALEAKAFDDLLKAGGKNHLLELTIEGGARDTALVRDVQRHPITRRVIHADLQRVSATEKITASLPLVTIGTPDGVKNSGGVMDVLVHAIDVTGPANALPEHIEADVSHLKVGDHLTAAEIVLPSNIALAIDGHTMLISIEASKTAAEAEEVAPVAPVAADVPTVGETEAADAT
ncbi:MAG: 50S ribosomal protein L25 [Vulcanimicrobiaceae bacterium]